MVRVDHKLNPSTAGKKSVSTEAQDKNCAMRKVGKDVVSPQPAEFLLPSLSSSFPSNKSKILHSTKSVTSLKIQE